MGSTLIEKIIEKNTGLSKVTPGQIAVSYTHLTLPTICSV